MKYVKKPIVVEAFQLGVDDIPVWFVSWFVNEQHEGPTAYKGDMIIKGIQGEIYPCKKDIFDATYDLVETEKPFKYPVIGSEDD